MENGKLKDFIESIGYNDNIIEYKGKYYFFSGFDFNVETQLYAFTVYETSEKGYGNIENIVFYHESKYAQECIDKFLEAKIWDGKSFFEIENSVKWID